MNKRILFLYSDIKYKNQISECEAVLKTVLRKFRKSAIFSYQYVDLSTSASKETSDAIISLAQKHDALIWQSGKDTMCEERIFASNVLGVFAKEQFIGGRCICSPISKISVLKSDEAVSVHKEIFSDNISGTVQLAALRSQMRKHSLLLCMDKTEPLDILLMKEFENSLGKERAITASFQDFDELVLESIYKIPAFDVLLTSEKNARTIALHLSSLQRVPCGYVLWHAPKAHIYRREILPHEEMSNSAYASFLIACADALCNDLKEKSASEWLRRSTTLALEQYNGTSSGEFLNEVIRQINTPMRNRQVNSDDSKN